MTAVPPLGPVREPERIASLDVLRGVALLGILMVNMQIFAMPFGEFFAPSVKDEPASQAACWVFVKVLFEYKFISLFSLLFGGGLVIQMTRAEQRGRRFVPVFLRRLGLLAVIGLAHGFLLWYGDILFVYACIGAVALLFRRLKPRTLLITAGSILGGFMALQAVFAVVIIAIATVAAPAEDAEDEPDKVVWSEANPEAAERFPWLAVMFDSGFNVTGEAWREAETTAYREGPLGDALGFRAVSYVFAISVTPLGYGWHVLVMFLTGAALMKLGLFAPARVRWHRRLCVAGLAVGLPIEIAFGGLAWAAVFNERMELMAVGGVLHEVGSVSLCLGLVGGVCWMVSRGVLRPVTGAVACVGRLALSNYLLQTIVATSLMYWWGLGWFGEVSRPQQIGLVLLIYAGQVLASVLYLRVFTIGPLEWAWRSLTYLRLQPILRRRVSTAA